MILVIGGSSFIGRGIQEIVKDTILAKDFVFAYNMHQENISENFQKIRINLQDKKECEILREFTTCVYLAGNSNHGLAFSNPDIDLTLNVESFLNFMKYFRGQMVLLSSQAVYYGLKGEISEDTTHYPTIPYGLSKRFQEEYAKYFYRIGYLSKLWVFRLMYAFGKGERTDRLIPKCVKAVIENKTLKVLGGGNSFLNPLPVTFVARVLINAILSITKEEKEFFEITNINYPEKVTVLDVVKFLYSIKPFNYVVEEEGEIWPVSFYGSTNNLFFHLRGWNMKIPDIWEEMKSYFQELLRIYGG
jgi:nucleoside-diphosphate-sugar epimerase